MSGDLVMVCNGRELVGVERESGETRWHHEPESYSRLGVTSTGESLYASSIDEGAVAAFSTT